MSNIPVIASFDYAILPDDLADDARRIAAKIRARITTGFQAIGHDLIEMKERLGHGSFVAWLDAEFGMTPRSAQRYMSYARFEQANCDSVSLLLPGTMHALAAPSLPEPVRVACIARVKAGERLLPNDVATAASDARLAAQTASRRRKAVRKHDGRGDDGVAEAAERHRDAVNQALAELLGLIVDALGDDRGRALALLRKLPFYMFPDVLRAALERAQ